MRNSKNKNEKRREVSWKKVAVYGLIISIFLAIFISPFASKSPDGLEKVAETNSFISRAKENSFSLAKDYQFPGIKQSSISTALSGFVGTIFLFVSVYGLFSFIPKKRNRKQD